MKVAIDFSADQMGAIAAAVVEEMERQGKVMVQPERTRPWKVSELVAELQMSEWSIRRWSEAGRLKRVPGTSKMLFTADSVRAVQKGDA